MTDGGKPYEKRLEEFVFDALGDMVPPSDLEVLPDRKAGGFKVVCMRSHGMPREMLWDEWARQTQGTEFEGVPFYAI